MGNGNNQNGNHNTNGHHPNGGVNLNGNGQNGHHNGNGVAEITGHDLLWDGLPPAVVSALEQPLDPALVSRRDGRGNRQYDYIEGHTVIDQANRIFGYGGWGYELVGDVSLRRIEKVDVRTGEIKVNYAYSAPVRVSVVGAPPRTDIGFHIVTDDNPGGPRDRRQGGGDRRAEAGAAQLRGPVRQRPLRRPAPANARAGAPASNARGNGNGNSARATTATAGGTAATSSSCGGGSSPWARSRASTRTGCGSWCGSRRARTWTTCPPRTSSPWWRTRPARSTRRRTPRATTAAATARTPGPSAQRGRLQRGAAPLLIYRIRRNRK